ALGERDGTVRVRQHRFHHRAVVPLREPAQLVADHSRLLGLTRGQRDLGVGRQEREALQAVGDLSTRASNRRQRRVETPLREPELCEPGLWLPAETARLAIRSFGFSELAREPQKLAFAIERQAGRRVL